MEKVAIMTDSACDLTEDLIKEHGLHIMPFTISVEGRDYIEGVDITPVEYIELLRKIDSLPVTNHITSFRFMEKYAELEKAGYTDVILVTICSRGSATYDAAHMALKQYKDLHPNSNLKIHIIDSRGYSQLYGQAVCEAADMLKQGKSVDEIVAYLKDVFSRLEIVLATYSLKYIRHSGRISAAAALAGDFLGLRPIITLIDGVSAVKAKVRGDKQVLPALVKHLKESAVPGTPYLIGTTDMKNAEELAALCEKAVGYPPIRCFYLGCCVSTNTGPETIAMVYYGQPRPHYLKSE